MDTQIYVKGTRVATEAELGATSTTINTRITNEVSTLNNTINTLDTTVNARIDDEVDTLNNTIDTLDSTINSRIDDEVSTLNTTISDEVSTLNDTIQTLEDNINDRIDTLSDDTQASIDDLQEQIGDLDNLTTTDKTNLVNAMDEVFGTFSNYLSKTNTTAYMPSNTYHPTTKKYVDDAIAAIRQLHFEIVQTLPATGDPTIIYMLLQQPGLGQDDYYDEYIYINNTWEKIGSTRIDLSAYATITYVDSTVHNIKTFYEIQTDANISWSNTTDSGVNLIGLATEIANAINDARSKGSKAPIIYLWAKNMYLWFDTCSIDTNSWRPSRMWFYAHGGFNTRHQPQDPDEIVSAQLAVNLSWNAAGDICTCTSVYLYPKFYYVLSTDNTWNYTPSSDYNPATKKYVDDWVDSLENDINDINNKFYTGLVEEWEEFTEEEKEEFLLAVVDWYADLNVEDAYNLQSITGDDEEVIADIYEDEAIEMTDEIIGG